MLEIINTAVVTFIIIALIAIKNDRDETRKAIKEAIEYFVDDKELDEVVIQKSFGYIRITREELGL